MAAVNGNTLRRDVLIRFLQACATAAGLSAVQTEKLLAQARTVKTLPDVTRLVGIPARDNNVKALKILLMPKSHVPQVFRSEFGRDPEFAARKYPSGGGSYCHALVGGNACSKLECGIHVCSGVVSLPLDRVRQESLAAKKYTTGECVSVCNWFCFLCWSCPKFSSAAWETRINEPFLEAFVKEFKITSADELDRELAARVQSRQRVR